ncbi:MAG TPA: FtsW/RodA/SpoVE family cell cycle protein [Tepidisphaeraceae bacterium]|nr:FtsW/RodA/SpoVE family cell cycle protein [Tepidisphaeraceae bacterium]
MLKRLWEQLAIATNWPVLVATAVLVSIGVISIWADAAGEGRRQLTFVVVGLMCMAAFQAVNYQIIGRFAWVFYLAAMLLVAYTVVGAIKGGPAPVPLVRNVKGAYNWIHFGAFSLQPAELMKISFVMVMARYLRFRSNYRTLPGLIPPFLIAGVPLVLILKQPDLGTALVFLPVLFAMLYVAGAKPQHLATVVAAVLMLSPIAWFAGKDKDGIPFSRIPGMGHLPTVVKDYQRERVKAMFSNDPDTLQKTGFQQEQALIAMGSGGVAGKGFGQIPVGQRVPESHNDMVFALVGEQFGFFGSAVVLGAYIVLFTAGLEISSATKEPFGKLVAVGIVVQLAGQTFINLMVVTRLMPVTGITLPFVSYGGSSLLASFMAVGLLLNIGQNRPLVIARSSFEY